MRSSRSPSFIWVELTGVVPKAAGPRVLFAHGIDLLRCAMPMALPIAAKVALEAALFGRRKAAPDRIGFRTKRVEHRAPIESAFGSLVDVPAKAMQQCRGPARVERGDHVVRCDLCVYVRKAAIAG